MNIDTHEKALELLGKVANSVHERDPKNPNLLFFSGDEVQLVREWLNEFTKEVTTDCVCLSI